MVAEWKEKIKEKQKNLDRQTRCRASAPHEEELKLIEGEIKRQQKLLADNEKAIASIVERLNQVPGVEVALGAIERDYQTKKAALRSARAATAKNHARCGRDHSTTG